MSVLIGTASASDISGTLVVSILVAAGISSTGAGTRNENSDDTYPNVSLDRHSSDGYTSCRGLGIFSQVFLCNS